MIKVYPNSSLKHARISKDGLGGGGAMENCKEKLDNNYANSFEVLNPGNFIKKQYTFLTLFHLSGVDEVGIARSVRQVHVGS
jgi:hypothetical protein